MTHPDRLGARALRCGEQCRHPRFAQHSLDRTGRRIDHGTTGVGARIGIGRGQGTTGHDDGANPRRREQVRSRFVQPSEGRPVEPPGHRLAENRGRGGGGLGNRAYDIGRHPGTGQCDGIDVGVGQDAQCRTRGGGCLGSVESRKQGCQPRSRLVTAITDHHLAPALHLIAVRHVRDGLQERRVGDPADRPRLQGSCLDQCRQASLRRDGSRSLIVQEDTVGFTRRPIRQWPQPCDLHRFDGIGKPRKERAHDSLTLFRRLGQPILSRAERLDTEHVCTVSGERQFRQGNTQRE